MLTEAKACEQATAAGVPLPTAHKLKEIQATHLEESHHCFAMSIDNNTTWEQVQVVEHYIEGKHAAHLPHGYFYPDMLAA